MLSQLEGVTLELYTTVVLPRILEQASALRIARLWRAKAVSGLIWSPQAWDHGYDEG